MTAIAARPHSEAAQPLMTHRQILFVVYGLMAGMFLSSLDQTIVGTAIRTIGDDLHGLAPVRTIAAPGVTHLKFARHR